MSSTPSPASSATPPPRDPEQTGGRARRPRPGSPREEVASITDAPPSLADDQNRRMRRYLWQMGLRLVCFVGAAFAGGGWLTWVLIAAAVVLPYVAVLLVNAGRDRQAFDVSPMDHPALPPARRSDDD